MYRKLYVLEPKHAGSGVDPFAATDNGRPQASETEAGMGKTASAKHATVDDPFAGIVTFTVPPAVIVCVTSVKFPQLSVIR